MRWLLTGLMAVLVMALLPSVPASASVLDHYHTATSISDNSPRKAVTVNCPAGEIVFGFGGSTVDSDGHVALVGIFPNEDLTAVTAIAHARAGWAGSWSVRAVATCWPPGNLALQRVVATGGPAAAQASCPGQKILYSSGYRVSSPSGSPYVDAVVPAPDLSSVSVHAGGGLPGYTDVSAVALCGVRMPGELLNFKERTQTTVPVAAEPTTTAVAPPPRTQGLGYVWVLGAGVKSTRPGMFIDALGPVPALNGGWARMSRGTSPTPSVATVATEDDEVTAYGTCIGSWY